MITGYCHTNLDGYETEKFPKIFCAVPQKGDRVKAESGKELKVVEITYYVKRSDDIIYVSLHKSCRPLEPEIIVELNK